MAEIPLYYRIFFLYIEPIATLVGAVYAALIPNTYLELTDASSRHTFGKPGLSTATLVILRQLGNMYFAFAFNEAVVLRATNDLRVWRAFLLGLLIADFGHLLSCSSLGLRIYYDVMNWNAIDFGNLAFVYVGALTRIGFLAGVGFTGKLLGKKSAPKGKSTAARKQKAKPAPAALLPPDTPSPVTTSEDSPAKAVTKTPRSTRRSRPKAPA